MKAAQLDTSQLWYAASNEDSRSEIAAIQPSGRDLLIITASGSRSFDLLLADPARIVSIDQNPAQTALADLLAAAYRTLDYPAFAAFTGLSDSTSRAATLGQLARQLPPESAAFWARNAALVERGVIYAGKWEGYLRLIQRLAGGRRRAIAARLLAAPDLDRQYAIWRDEWDDRAWHLFLRLLSVRPFWKYVLREPGIAFVPADFAMGDYARGRFDHAAHAIPLANTHFAWLLLAGRYPAHVLPAYLTEAGHATIRTRLDRITFRTQSLQDALATSDAGAFTGASLSDYSSYCDTDVQRHVWTGLARAIASGGRVCERKFFNKSGADIPESSGFTRDRTLEEQLTARDGAIFYSIIAATRT